jgi:chromate transporter
MIPGATAMQMTAYVGMKMQGVTGAAASFIGFGLPAFLFMMALAALYSGHHDLAIVSSAFSGLQAVVIAIMANATLTFGRNSLRDWKAFVIAGIAAALFGLSVDPVLVILLAAVIGFALIKPRDSDSGRTRVGGPFPSYTKPVLLILSISAVGFALLSYFRRPLFDLAGLMFRIDLFAFGGGFASVPLMFHEVVEVRHWLDGPTFMNGIVLGQVTPGPIVITATFVGFLLGGPIGGVIATVGMLLPSFLLVVGISPYFDRLRNLPSFQKAIAAALCSFVGLLLTVTIRFAFNVHWDLPHALLALAALLALLRKVDILWVVVAGTVLAVLLFTRF